jgi:hypothetical protein
MLGFPRRRRPGRRPGYTQADIEGSWFECVRQRALYVRYMRNSARVHRPLLSSVEK